MTFPHLTGAPSTGLPTQERPVPGHFLRHVQDQIPHRTRAPPSLRCQFLPLFSTPSLPTGPCPLDTMRGRYPLCADNNRINVECATSSLGAWGGTRRTLTPFGPTASDSTLRNHYKPSYLPNPIGGEYA